MMHTSVNQKGFYDNRVSYRLIAHASSNSQLYDHERAISVILLKLLMAMDFDIQEIRLIYSSLEFPIINGVWCMC